ncbi:TRAP transporter small permease [Anaeroselena agilis]|uniref:TRAP transporter small permease n=1 Tax=Anaeroselena agilis TaxID=3063788 RepID=A0ABU3NXI2_9FIRM|nr:TRAP transporter small permease [Selenomonadales bacterium 4137-cl]
MQAFMDKVAKAEYILLAVMIALMAIINFLQVVFRYLLHGSLPWSEETLRFLFIWATFIGASIGVRKGAHLGLTFVIGFLPPKLKTAVAFITYGLCLVFAGIIAYLGFQVVVMQIEFNVRSSAMGIPMWWPSLAIPVSFILMILHIVNLARGHQDKEQVRIEN